MYVISQENFALISAAKSISLAHMYDVIYTVLQSPDEDLVDPNEGSDPAAGNLKAWFGAAAQTNSGVGGASDLIRAYTQTQLEIREGESISGINQILQGASDAIAESVFDDIEDSQFSENGKLYYIIPDVEQIGKFDAQATLSGLGSFGSSNAIWSGNPLFVGLGIGRFWNETVLETAGDTYDLVIAVHSLVAGGINSLSNLGDLFGLFWDQGDPGRSQALAQVATTSAATEAFFEAAYGYFAVNGLIGLFGDQRVIGSKDVDLSLEQQSGLIDNTFMHGGTGNDLLVGSTGVDMLDGGTGADDASFYMVSGEMAQGLRASIFNLDSSAQFSAFVEGVDVKSALFNIESLELGRQDDILEIADLDSSTTGLSKVYGGENGALGDTIDLSYVTTVGATVNLQDGTLKLTGSQETLNVYDFENVVGTSHNDVVTGDDQANGINGHLGADEIFAGGGDDFIFFDAADGANVNGGDGKDVAFAVGDAGVSVNMAAQELECAIGSSGSDTFVMNSSVELMAAGGGGADTFEVGFGPGTCIVWGGEGADDIVFTEAYHGTGIMVANVEGLTTENFHLFDKSMLGLGEGFDWTQIDLLILNPDSGDSISFDYGVDGVYALSVNHISTNVEAWLPGPEGSELVNVGTVDFLADTTFVVPLDHHYQVDHYSQTFLNGYSGSVFTSAQVVQDSLTVVEQGVPGGDSYVQPDHYGEIIDDQPVFWNSLAEGRGFFGSGWDFEVDTEYDLSGADYVSQSLDQGGGYSVRAHYFESRSEGSIGYPGYWFIVGGGLSGSQITGAGAISADMTGITDPNLSGWLLVA